LSDILSTFFLPQHFLGNVVELSYPFDAEQGQIYRSNDGARSFKKIVSALPRLPNWKLRDGNLRAVPEREWHFFVTTGAQLYRSKDFGRTVGLVVGVEKSYLIGFGKPKSPRHYPTIFLWGKVANEVGFFLSDDEGAHWVKLNDDEHQYGSASCLIGDMRTYGRFYVDTSGQGIVVGEALGQSSP
jgi:hypothetical protein